MGLGGGPIVASTTTNGIQVALQGAPWTSGAATLVTPIAVETSLGTQESAFGVLTVHFIPEPGGGLLLVFGAALLSLLGWRRTGRR